LLLQAKSATPSISSPFYPKDVGAFSLQRIDFIEQNTKLFTSLLSENDIGWQTFTMLFRGRKYNAHLLCASPPFLGLFNLLVLNFIS